MKPDVKGMAWGGPTIGKTSFIYQLAQELGYPIDFLDIEEVNEDEGAHE